MIKFNAKLLSRKSDPFDNIEIEIANKLAEGTAKKFQEKLKDKKCDVHPGQMSFINVNAVKGTIPKMTKGSFCCQEFSDLINLK